MKKTPLRRKTALKSKVGLKRSKGLKKIRPSVKSAQAKQREAVKKRAEVVIARYSTCEFLVVSPFITEGDYPERCIRLGTQMAHIIPRRECGKARDLPEVVVWACTTCHRAYDDTKKSIDDKPRVPKDLREACFQAIEAAHLRSPLPASQRKKLTTNE